MVFNPPIFKRYIPVLTGVLLLSVSTVIPADSSMIQSGSEAAAHLRRGKLLFSKNDFAGAIESYNKAIELKPMWAEAYLQRGTAKRMHGQLAGAIADFDKATEFDPKITQKNRTVAGAYTNHGQILAGDSHLEEAITSFDKALKIYPEGLRPYYERAQARMLKEDFHNAVADYDLFIVKEKDDSFSRALAYLERGLTKSLMGRDKESSEDMKQGVKLAGEYAKDLLLRLEFLRYRVIRLHELRARDRKAIG